MIFFIDQYLKCEIIFTMHISQHHKREYFVPQNSKINSQFHSDAKLLLVTWYPLTNHSVILLHKTSANHESASFSRLFSSFGYSQTFFPQRVKILPIDPVSYLDPFPGPNESILLSSPATEHDRPSRAPAWKHTP